MNTLDIVLHQSLISIEMDLCSIDECCPDERRSLLQSSMQLLANGLIYKDIHFAIGCLLSLNVSLLAF